MKESRALLLMLFRLAHRRNSNSYPLGRYFSCATTTRPIFAGDQTAHKQDSSTADHHVSMDSFSSRRLSGFSASGAAVDLRCSAGSIPTTGILWCSRTTSSPYTWMSNHGCHQIHTSTASRRERDFYEVLGISPNSSPSEIKRAYYQLAKKLHPDSSKEPNANEKFQELQKAYSTLKDPEKKRMYDQLGHDNYERMDSTGGDPSEGGFSGGFGGASMHDIFNAFMGGARRGGFEDMFGGSSFVAQVQQQVQISFMEAVEGCSRELSVTGSKQKVKVEFEAGVETGDMLSVRPLPQVELILNVVVKPHKIFKREGLNIIRVVGVDSVDAILGTTVVVETVRGRTIHVTVPECTQDNDRLVVSGEGVRTRKRAGDFLLLIKLKNPSRISERQRQLLLEFQNETSKMGRAA